jgi:hypothetical protein
LLGVPSFQFDQKFFVFFPQSFQNIGVQDYPEFVNFVLVFPHYGIQSAMQFDARGHRGFDHAAPLTIRAVLIDRITQAFLRPLPGHFH